MITKLFGKNKKRYGIQEKQRFKEEIDREYSHHAMMYGHITRLIQEHEELLGSHLKKMEDLAAEGRNAPNEPKKEEPKTETPPAAL